MKILKAMSALLAYPSEELIAALCEIEALVRADELLPAAERASLAALVADLGSRDLYDLQESYLFLFDRTRSLSLHIFEHVHGQSRDRGQAMVDLRALYERKGLASVGNELPDHTPVFLEFLSLLDPAEALDLLSEPVHVFAALAERLERRRSAYAAVFRALVGLSQARPDAALLAALQAEPDPEPDDLAALDAAWEDAPVEFGAPPTGGGACPDTALLAGARNAERSRKAGASAPPRTEFVHSKSLRETERHA